jgi:2-methylisocitrate lyase-like PEP mutase family enzyme
MVHIGNPGHAEAGADVIFVEAPVTEVQIQSIARRVAARKPISMLEGGKTPRVPLDRLQAPGYRTVIIPSDLHRAAIRAMEQVPGDDPSGHRQPRRAERMASFAEREAVRGTKDYVNPDRRYNR